METVQINIEGMTCNGCAGNVTKVLAHIPGVSSVEVSLEQKRAAVTYDPAQAGLPQFKTAIEDAGFDVV
ncbi:MAG: heavy-metal-associated domain-containing protein [Gallionellaceae bacterium]|jgi:copper chaperone|nr:heavy-metal-associated domain-containing protein [Gallionellaceae bacterium]